MTYDMIIIGSGAGGGTLARHLAKTGKKILILERGDFLPREKENWNVEEVFVKNRYICKDTWLDKEDKSFQPQVHYYVGGATKFYGDLKKSGYHPFPAPAAVMLHEEDMPFSPCIRCATCDGFPCLLLAKADAETAGGAPCPQLSQRHLKDPCSGNKNSHRLFRNQGY